MADLHFIIPGIPVGQPRHRVSSRGGFARLYLPKDNPVHAYKAAIKAAIGKQQHLTGPIRIEVNAWMPRPKATTWKTKPMPAYPHTGKPDADNILKAVLDACNRVAWSDDAQVYFAIVTKWVCAGGDEPCTEILISERTTNGRGEK